MMNFVSLDVLCNDLLYLGRGSKVVSAETLSIRQLEFWVHQYRSLLIKQDLDKGRWPDEGYIQEISAIRLLPIDRAGSLPTVGTNKIVYRSEIQLPKPLSLNNKDGILYIGTLDGTQIQFIAESRANWQLYRKFTSREPVAYIKDQYVYIITELPLEYIAIRGIFEIPTEVNLINNRYSNIVPYSYSDKYPLPLNMVSTIKELILKKELNIILETPSDNQNDSRNTVQTNVEKPE